MRGQRGFRPGAIGHPSPSARLGAQDLDCQGGGVHAADQSRHQVVAALVRRGNQILVARRCLSRAWWPGVWDLPGGHVEPGEDPRAALVRELAEELGITATVTGPPLGRVEDEEMVMDVWPVHRWEGEVANTAPGEHDALAWVDAAGAAALEPATAYLADLVATASPPTT